MKLIDTNIITKAEGIFYNEMSSNMDLATIGGLFRKHYNLRLSGEAEFQDREVVVHNGQIVFKFDYTALAYFSIYMNRSGEFVEIEDIAKKRVDKPKGPYPANSLEEAIIIQKRETQLAEALGSAIEKKTLARLIEVNYHAKLNGRLDFMGARFAVHKNQPVYKLVYQGKIALSFLLDEKGRFIDFAEAQIDSNEAENESKTADTKDDSEIDDFIVADEQQEVEILDLNDEVELDLLNDEELQDIEKLSGENESKTADTKDDSEIDDFIVADEQQEVEILDLNDEVELDLLNDEELQDIEKLFGEMEGPEQKRASNLNGNCQKKYKCRPLSDCLSYHRSPQKAKASGLLDIPIHSGRRLRLIPATDSGRGRPPIPEQVGYPQ